MRISSQHSAWWRQVPGVNGRSFPGGSAAPHSAGRRRRRRLPVLCGGRLGERWPAGGGRGHASAKSGRARVSACPDGLCRSSHQRRYWRRGVRSDSRQLVARLVCQCKAAGQSYWVVIPWRFWEVRCPFKTGKTDMLFGLVLSLSGQFGTASLRQWVVRAIRRYFFSPCRRPW